VRDNIRQGTLDSMQATRILKSFDGARMSDQDFNGDGKPDLALVTASGVSIFLGNGDGSFRAGGQFAAGAPSGTIAAGDFNADGKLDLAVTGTDAVWILLGNGDGTFQPATQSAAGMKPDWLAVGDFNGDGRLDLAVTNLGQSFLQGAISILLGNGDGTFQAPIGYPVGLSPACVVTGDINGDGIPDLAVADGGSNAASILLGNGDGTFQPAVSFAAGLEPGCAAVADFSGSGKPDLVAPSVGTAAIAILRNTTR
jgi:hypothetical protein